MNKVVFNQLIIEVTRRCNMKCAHCLRGNAENEDIMLSSIDGVLDQIEAIGRLIITGGEPTLNLSALQYIANGIASRGIPLMRLQIVTNGLRYDPQFVAIIKRFSEIIRLTQKHGYNHDNKESWRAEIGISLDRYHEKQDACKANYIRYKRDLRGYADVLRVSHGNAPKNEGRGALLTDTIDYEQTANTYMLQQIEVLSADYTPMCKFYESYHLERADQKIICCGIYLNALGQILPGVACDLDYDCRGMMICYSWDDIWAKVIEYNGAHGRHSCTVCDDYRAKISMLRSAEQANREFALMMAPAAQDEPNSEPVYIGDIRRYRENISKWGVPDQYSELEKAALSKDYMAQR